MASPANVPQRRRRRWPIVVVVLVAIAALVTGVSMWFQKFPPSSATADPSTSDAAWASSSASPSSGLAEAPNGCIAGSGTVDAAAFIAAASKASKTTSGAAAVAGAYLRWATRAPYPSVEEGREVVRAMAAKKADASITALPTRLASLNAEGTNQDARLTLSDGRYLVESANEDEVTVSVGGSFIQNGQPVSDYGQANTITLKWESNRWKLAGAHSARTTEDLFTNGARFAGGC